MTVFTVTVLAVRVTMLMKMVMSSVLTVAVVVVLEGYSGLLPGSHVQPVLLLQLPPGFIPLGLQLGQCPTDKLLLEGEQGEMKRGKTRERDKLSKVNLEKFSKNE